MNIPSYYYDEVFKYYKEDLSNIGITEFYKKGEFLNKSGEYMDYSFYVVSGILRYYNVSDEGKEKTTWYIGKDGLFPLYSPVEKRFRVERENSLVEAVTDVQVIKVRQRDMREYMKQNSRFMLTMLDKYADLAGLLLYESLNFSTRDNLTNICNYLYHYETVLKPKGILLSQEKIANNIGTTTLNLARSLKILRDKNIIVTKRNNIEVIDINALKAMCNGNIVP